MRVWRVPSQLNNSRSSYTFRDHRADTTVFMQFTGPRRLPRPATRLLISPVLQQLLYTAVMADKNTHRVTHVTG